MLAGQEEDFSAIGQALGEGRRPAAVELPRRRRRGG